MKPSRHLATSAVFSLVLTPWLAWRSLWVLAGGVLVDLDRYLWYAVRHRTLRLGPVIEQFQGRDRIRGDPRFFHSIEFLIALLLGGFLHHVVRLFALGVGLHVVLDLFVHKKHGDFSVRFEPSQLRCLTLDWVRKFRHKAGAGNPTAEHVEDRE